MSVLIVGGTSGLGLELAKKYIKQGSEVIVTGRRDPRISVLKFHKFDLSGPNLAKRISEFVDQLPDVDVLVYAAGFYQEGTITDLTEKQIEDMLNVGGRALVYFARAILKKQGHLDKLVTITSTSQWTPRKLEPIYNFTKAAAGHFTNSLAEDGRIRKVMVVGPSGMKTDFWREINHPDFDNFLDPRWVADQIDASQKDTYRYKYIRILRQPARVEEVEKR